MTENVAPVSFSDGRAVLGGLSEGGPKVRPCRGKFRNNDASIPGVVGHKRPHVQAGVIRAPVVDQLDSGSDAIDMGLDRRNRMWCLAHGNVGLDANRDFELES